MEGKRAEAIALALPRPAEVSQELVWPLLVALSTAAAIVPFWASALLPYQDAPQHIAAVRDEPHPEPRYPRHGFARLQRGEYRIRVEVQRLECDVG